MNLELSKSKGEKKKRQPKPSIQTDIQNIYSSIPELAKKVLFSNISRKLNSFDKRTTRIIESTDGSLVHMIISGATFPMRL